MYSADRPIVKLTGDYSIIRREELRDDLYALRDEDAIAIDLSDVGYMDSTGLGVLVNFNKRFVEKGGPPIKLLNIQPRLLRLFSITGLARVFDIS
ncbi:MAG: anti-sigma factor antagonist RsbV [Vulcanimicrobiaceae bacterium]